MEFCNVTVDVIKPIVVLASGNLHFADFVLRHATLYRRS